MTQPTQEQMFYQAQRRAADTNDGFLYLVSHGLTRSYLERNIARRPSLCARFANWLARLPETRENGS